MASRAASRPFLLFYAGLFALLAASCGSGSRPPARRAGDAELPGGPPPLAPAGPRLPDDVRPEAYRLELDVDPSSSSFSGRVRIVVESGRPRSAIFLHGKGLHVTTAAVRLPDGTSRAARYAEIRDDGVAVLYTRDELPKGRLELLIEYDAPFGAGLEGLYKVRDGAGDYAFTQFEPTAAREAFPCFDEPSRKARFELSLAIPEGLVAVANSPEHMRRRRAGGGELVRFRATPPISTYLVAFAVGPFDVVDAGELPPNEIRERPLSVRGIAARGRGPQLASALARVEPILGALERYFGTPYPYEKLDLLAVPDFAAGAMENVGLVAFREALLLLSEPAPDWQERAVVYVMAHELAHMWFGNLVTMDFWDDLWLNEAFATLLSYRAAAEVHPEFQPALAELQAIQSAMVVDRLTTARRVRQPIEDAHDIRNAFDAITYRKGAGVLRMFEGYVGAEAFREGVRAYLEEHAEGNASVDDLVRALERASGKPLAGPFASFLDQSGLPLVAVEIECADDPGGDARLALRQTRYLPLGAEHTRETRRWQIPLCVRYGGQDGARETCGLLEGEEGHLQLPGVACPTFVLPNAGAAGYYRFALQPAALEGLFDSGVAHLTAEEQLAAIDSAVGGFEQALVPFETLYSLLGARAESQERALATAPIAPLGFVVERVADESARARARAKIRQLYAKQVRALGFEPRGGEEDAETRLLRAEVLDFVARVGEDAPVRAQLLRRARAFLGAGGDGRLHREAIDPGLLGPALIVAAQDGGGALYDAMELALVGASDALLRTHLLRALGSATDPALAERARALALDPRVRAHEAVIPLFAQLDQPEARDGAFAYAIAHWDELVERLGRGRAGTLARLGSAFCSNEDAERVRAALGRRVRRLAGGPRELASTLESVRLCAARVAAQRAEVSAFFAGAH